VIRDDFAPAHTPPMHGKPILATECGADAVSFNVSYSDGIAQYAVAPGPDIGVDVADELVFPRGQTGAISTPLKASQIVPYPDDRARRRTGDRRDSRHALVFAGGPACLALT